MTKETERREPTPAELWDQLAIQTIKRQLAPNGYKKVYHGKAEVSNIQFLGKQTVNQTCTIGANMVRLFRENVKERYTALLTERDQWRVKSEDELKVCRFWQFKKKRQLRNDITAYAVAGGMIRFMINELNDIKPSNPKPIKKK